MRRQGKKVGGRTAGGEVAAVPLGFGLLAVTRFSGSPRVESEAGYYEPR